MIGNIKKSSLLRRNSFINQSISISCRSVFTDEEKKQYLSVKPYTLPNHHKVPNDYKS